MIKLRTFFLHALLLHTFIYCSDDSVGPAAPALQISPPLQQKAVYSDATYYDFGDSLVMDNLRISSLIFNEANTVNDTTYLTGTSEQYRPTIMGEGITQSGALKLALSDDWILLEDIAPDLSSNFLFKTNADCTGVASLAYQHFPVAPRKLTGGKSHELIRAEYSGEGWQLKKVHRQFNIGQEIKWEDSYGFDEGLFVETLEFPFQNDTLYISSIYDEHGIVISQYTINLIISSGADSDTIRVHQLNRRISDFDNPLFIQDLKSYADLIMQNGLTLLYQ